MPVKYRNATDVVAPIAAPLIAEKFAHLLEHQVRIEYVFRSVPQVKDGKEVWGMCRKIGSLNAFLAAREETPEEKKQEPFFVIELAEPVWKVLKPEHREALLHHEFSHAGAEFDDKGKTRLFIIPHDLEEFQATYREYGAWRQSIVDFLNAANPSLDFEGSPGVRVSEPAPNEAGGSKIPLPGIDNPHLLPSFGVDPAMLGPGVSAGSLPGGNGKLLQIEAAGAPASDIIDADYTELPQERLSVAPLVGVELRELRTSKRRVGEMALGSLPSAPGGEGAQVIRLEGGRFVVVTVDLAKDFVECRHVVQSSEWSRERTPYTDPTRAGAPCCIGMQVVDESGVHWIIDSDVVYQVLPIGSKAS